MRFLDDEASLEATVARLLCRRPAQPPRLPERRPTAGRETTVEVVERQVDYEAAVQEWAGVDLVPLGHERRPLRILKPAKRPADE